MGKWMVQKNDDFFCRDQNHDMTRQNSLYDSCIFFGF